MLSRALRFWRTVRYLKPAQIVGRVRFRLRRPHLDPRAVAPPLREPVAFAVGPADRPPAMIGKDRFRFLGAEHDAADAAAWNSDARDKLWLYNLHYFDDLNARDAADRFEWHRDLIARWIAENPPASGNGWEPYPTSLRIVNWVQWLAAGNAPPTGMLDSLAQQARWLSGRLEWHLLGNHLFANAKALICAGSFFAGREADGWRETGLAIVARELPEQVLGDGGNFERSPMYHAIFLDDVLTLIAMVSRYPGTVAEATLAEWRRIAGKMLEFLEGMSHPDGEIALFNDAAFGIAPTTQALRAQAGRLGVVFAPSDRRLRSWPDTGYVRVARGGAVALLDVGPVGPDYLPGHAHADTLSFELSLHGERIVVNGGTSRYGSGPERTFERGTAAHSTVEVAGENSSEVWAGFRVARRAYPVDLAIEDAAAATEVACSHDGYARLKGRPIHRRRWRFGDTSLLVEDTVSDDRHRSVARFILHPAVRIAAAEPGVFVVTAPGETEIRIGIERGRGVIEPAFYAPRFGERGETRCLAVELDKGRSLVLWSWP